MRRVLLACVWILIACVSASGEPIAAVKQRADGVELTTQSGILRIQPWSDRTIRVTYASGEKLQELNSLSVVNSPAASKWSMRETPEAIVLETTAVHVQVDRASGRVSFLDSNDKPVLQETPGGRETSPAVRQGFVLPPDEGIYGLGQHQQGVWNYHGKTVRLLQRNTEVGIPVMLSSKGYGLFWDNPAVTEVSVGAPLTMPSTKSTATRNTRPPPPDGAGEGVLRWSSEVGTAIDYYFVYGPDLNDVIKSYRQLTGDAPMMGEWFWGFWQCKERYRTQEELLGIAKKYRELNVPIDGIIQDWRYWPEGNNTWGSHQFDKTRYPDPAAMFKELHDLHFHALISVWAKFDLGSENFKELEQAGGLYPQIAKYVFPPGQGKWYDAFNPKARLIYWDQIKRELFSLGVDGWWLDAPEPEIEPAEYRTYDTGLGKGATVYNAFPLMHSGGIFQGQRAATDEKRIAILTRSAYAGQQRNAAVTWSGDIGGSWDVFRRQIPAGLNFCASGIPYWNTDIGGFFGDRSTGNMNPQDPKYQEIFTRWFQFGAFCPMFRVHGSAPQEGKGPGKEIWRFDEKTQATWKNFVNLRYRLMPYLYSVSWMVTHDGYSMMRPLVMDFREDPKVREVGDQFMFGPAIMVNPVTRAGATTRPVYLPEAKAQWYDFWTGKVVGEGKQIDAPAPVETMPLYVRPGSIIPLGPVIQYTGEKPADPIELRIYRGANGEFTLYEDEGDSYRYEKGVYATIPITWNESTKTLTLGQRKGEFPGMIKERNFNIVFVDEQNGDGIDEAKTPDTVVTYRGRAMTVEAKKR